MMVNANVSDPGGHRLAREVVGLLAALGIALLGVVGSLLVLSMRGRPTPWSAAAAFLVLVLGFAGVRVAAVPRHPARPLRLALGCGAVICLFLMLGLPWPPHGAERKVALVLGGSVVASLAAAILTRRAPLVTVGLVCALAAYGASIAVRFVTAAPPPSGEVALQMAVSIVLAGGAGAAWLAALLQLRKALGDV